MGLSLQDVEPWGGLTLLDPAEGGNRNDVWRADCDGRPVAVRRSCRPADSLAWELKLLDFVAAHNFNVPTVVASRDGRSTVNGIVVQEWLDGDPPSSERDWQLVAAELQRLHQLTGGYEQRPGCTTVEELRRWRRSVDADLDALPTDVEEELLSVFESLGSLPSAVIHGDPHESNIRVGSGGSVSLLDWDESRVDVTWLDLSNLGVVVLGDTDHAKAQALSHAWEAANGWLAEPAYARRRLDELRKL